MHRYVKREVAETLVSDASGDMIEKGYLLLGRLNEDSYSLFVEELRYRAEGTKKRVQVGSTFPLQRELYESGLLGELCIPGWAHTHNKRNGHLKFSRRDKKTQRDFQDIFPEAVALVGSPTGIGMWRLENGIYKLVDFEVVD